MSLPGPPPVGCGRASERLQELRSRGRRAVARHGWTGALAAAAVRARDRIALYERHVWYALDPASERPRRELEPGLVLRPGGLTDLPLLDQLPTGSAAQGRRRLAGHGRLWLVMEGGRPLFACWIFRGRAPAVAAPGGEIELEEGVACLEDSVTAAGARGRGIAPAAWSSIADGLAEEGIGRLVAKVEVSNLPSRIALEKVGFRGVALMRFARIASRGWTHVEAVELDRGGQIASMVLRP